jgi:hypothetical protein
LPLSVHTPAGRRQWALTREPEDLLSRDAKSEGKGFRWAHFVAPVGTLFVLAQTKTKLEE